MIRAIPITVTIAITVAVSIAVFLAFHFYAVDYDGEVVEFFLFIEFFQFGQHHSGTGFGTGR